MTWRAISARPYQQVLVLVSFAFFIFGIVGVQLFAERLRNKCGVLENPLVGCEACGFQALPGYANCSTSCVLPELPVWDFGDEEDLCSGVMALASYPAHGTGGSGRRCPYGTYCAAVSKADLPNFGGALQMQVHPRLTALGVCNQRLKLRYHEPLSNFAFNFKLRHYIRASPALTTSCGRGSPSSSASAW